MGSEISLDDSVYKEGYDVKVFERNCIEVITKDCENIGISFDSPHLQNFLKGCVIDAARPTRHAEWMAIL